MENNLCLLQLQEKRAGCQGEGQLCMETFPCFRFRTCTMGPKTICHRGPSNYLTHVNSNNNDGQPSPLIINKAHMQEKEKAEMQCSKTLNVSRSQWLKFKGTFFLPIVVHSWNIHFFFANRQ